ncbi:MAG: TonB-dependent receptor [Gammaproteobacteria bacterium]|jgi:iron complex outermembrane recepter protein|nr:TonB-dependent receptor [Gammaproteobacteria bacterium]MBT3867095.1 TonB-dependent receptor [Gammaproteobacteria bacterium]MBT4379950.1 TonB-dependent receptor [Gammaproteobacteria bacterium]MBT4616936.1 TonB-dependent receptor [Gammaproteobacteria bacterium]MBT5198612.1 TonB-dependent receptor [Gammaproteobacteria bacterium]
MRLKNMGKLGLAATLLFTTFTSLPVLSAEQKSGLYIEEIVVTSRKVEESSQAVPLAITAISEELASSTIRDLSDLNGFAPNVQIDSNGGRSGGAVINIRGISPTRSDDNSFDAPIGVMIDGIYMGTTAGQILENFDLERVEILRGPQGTLFGKNTVGGVLNVIRSRPTGEYGARMKATVGSDGQQELRAVVNLPLIDDKLAAKIFATSIGDDGYYRNITTGDNSGEKDYQNIGATFLWTPNDRFEATLTVETFQDDSLLNAYQTNYNVSPGVIAPPSAEAAARGEGDYSGGFATCTSYDPSTCRDTLKTPGHSENDTTNNASLDTDAITLNMRYEINDHLTLVSVTGSREVDEYRIYDFDGSAADYITIERWNEYEQFSQELRIDGSWDTLTLTAGLYYWRSEFEQDWVTGGGFWASLFGAVAYDPFLFSLCQGSNGLDGIFAPISCDLGISSVAPGANVTQILYEQQDTDSVAAFAQVEWQFAEDWTLTAGLRWTREEKDFIAGQSYLSNEERQRLRNFPGYSDLDNEWTETSPKLGLTYQLTDDSIVYGSYSEGFHSGGFFGVNQNLRDFERDQYDPEFAENWEIGYKSMHMDNRLRLNLTAFYNDFTDKQESFVALDPDTKTVASKFDNAGSVIYKGFEMEAEYLVNENLKIFFNYGYLDAEYDEFETDINATDGVDLIEDATHLTPRNAPESTLGIGGTFSYPIGNGDLEIYAKFARVGDIETSLTNAPLGRIDERDDVSASIGYYTEQWSVVAFGRNLADDEFEAFTPIATLFAVGSINRGRTFGLELAFEF